MVNQSCNKSQSDLSSIKNFIENKEVIDKISGTISNFLNNYDNLRLNPDIRYNYQLKILKDDLNNLCHIMLI